MAKAFLDAVGASSGPLYATAFLRAGTAVKDRLNLDAASMAAWIEAACEGVRERGGPRRATRPWSTPGCLPSKRRAAR